MTVTRRWSAAKCQRIQDKLGATVAGQTDDVEHLLDVLIAAWEEMHREAATATGAVEALREIAAWDGSRTLGYEGPQDVARRALGLTPGPEVELRDHANPPTAAPYTGDEPFGYCLIHGDYWTDDCTRCGR
jgi:hypothetical protein